MTTRIDEFLCVMEETNPDLAKPSGNVFVDTSVYTTGTICGEYENCVGCDRDRVHVEVV